VLTVTRVNRLYALVGSRDDVDIGKATDGDGGQGRESQCGDKGSP